MSYDEQEKLWIVPNIKCRGAGRELYCVLGPIFERLYVLALPDAGDAVALSAPA
jgi:hypothetical protein